MNNKFVVRLLCLVAVLVMPSAATAQIECCCTLNPGQQNGLCLAGSSSRLWTPGATLRIGFIGGTPSLQDRVKSAANEWTHHANIKFDFVQSGATDIRIAFQSGAGSWSYVGTDARNVPASQPTMNFGWFDDSSSDQTIKRTTLHEFGHALGMIHEHQSPKANIPWNKQVVYAHYQTTQTPPWNKAKVDFNIFRTYSAANTNFSAFDRHSIMLYPIPNQHTFGNYEVQANSSLSSLDKSHIRKLYPGQISSSYSVTLSELRCVKKQEFFGKDEVHLRVFADGQPVSVPHNASTPLSNIPIFKMSSGDFVNLNLPVTFKRTLKVEIWDIDNPQQGDENDLFGCVTIASNGASSETIKDAAGMFEKRPHEYRLSWQ